MAVDIFLKIDGIEGESSDDRHKNEIDVLSYAWGESLAASPVGGGGAAGKVTMQNFQFAMAVNKASPKLLLAGASGQHLKSAAITMRRAGRTQQEFLKWTLSDVLVTSYQTGVAAASDTLPTDQVSLSFARIEVEYRPQQPDGTPGPPVKAGWDVKANPPV